MKCRRICRELLWLVRFGEFGPSSAPHLEHLATCRGCRDEVGFDRAMVEQLRTALAARVEHANPPSTAWDRILARAQAPEPARSARLWELVGRLRVATAMAGTGLALVLALNMEVVTVGVPATSDATSESERTTLQQVPRLPRQQSSLEQLVREWGSGQGSTMRRQDPEALLTVAARTQPAARVSAPASPEEPAEQEPTTELRLVFRAMQTPEPAPTGEGAAAEPEPSAADLVESQPGEPS